MYNNNYQNNGYQQNNNNNNNYQNNNYQNNNQNGGGNNRNSSLVNILSRSFPGQSLLSVSLVRDDDPQRPWYKNKYYNFISIAPPIQNNNGNGGTSWDVKSRINMKVECEKVLGLGLALEKFILTNGNPTFQYTIYSDNSKSSYNNGQTQIKTIFISCYSKDKQTRNGNVSVLYFSISATSSMNGQSSNPFGYSGTAGDMLAIAEVIKMIGQEGLKLDFEFQKTSTSGPQQLPQQTNNMHPSEVNHNNQIPNNPPVGNMNPGIQQQQFVPNNSGPFPEIPNNGPPSIPTNTPNEIMNNFSNTLQNVANNQGQNQSNSAPNGISTEAMFAVPGVI